MPMPQTPYHQVVWCRSRVSCRKSSTTRAIAHAAVPTATARTSLVSSGSGSGRRSGFATPAGYLVTQRLPFTRSARAADDELGADDDVVRRAVARLDLCQQQ